jgi:hypothetical protein
MLIPESLTETPDAGARRRHEASLRYRKYVQELLHRRQDLQGVSKLADLMSDATRWAA